MGLVTIALSGLTAGLALAGVGAPGTTSGKQLSDAGTRVLKWKDGKRAVFLLAFDDSCQSHVTNAIPELRKRGMVGTFYICPGGEPYKNERDAWEKQIPATGMEYGNHTFTHRGAPSVEEFDEELRLCNEVINRCFPRRKQPRLISFGTPGVPKDQWRITDQQLNEALARYNLVLRPPFFGPPFQMTTLDEACKVIDTAIAAGEMGHLDFHGVGGDWHVASMELFTAILDKLDSRRDQLWLTDAISWHKYLTERQGAQVQERHDARQITVQLSSTADPGLYDLPLTLVTRVPAEWKQCVITHDATKTTVGVSNGAVQYEAIPGAAAIVIEPAGQ
jgi:peptidoglycan/xylan/chitin deacetylase (PgdA/CDA1 family)